MAAKERLAPLLSKLSVAEQKKLLDSKRIYHDAAALENKLRRQGVTVYYKRQPPIDHALIMDELAAYDITGVRDLVQTDGVVHSLYVVTSGAKKFVLKVCPALWQRRKVENEVCAMKLAYKLLTDNVHVPKLLTYCNDYQRCAFKREYILMEYIPGVTLKSLKGKEIYDVADGIADKAFSALSKVSFSSIGRLVQDRDGAFVVRAGVEHLNRKDDDEGLTLREDIIERLKVALQLAPRLTDDDVSQVVSEINGWIARLESMPDDTFPNDIKFSHYDEHDGNVMVEITDSGEVKRVTLLDWEWAGPHLSRDVDCPLYDSLSSLAWAAYKLNAIHRWADVKDNEKGRKDAIEEIKKYLQELKQHKL